MDWNNYIDKSDIVNVIYYDIMRDYKDVSVLQKERLNNIISVKDCVEEITYKDNTYIISIRDSKVVILKDDVKIFEQDYFKKLFNILAINKKLIYEGNFDEYIYKGLRYKAEKLNDECVKVYDIYYMDSYGQKTNFSDVYYIYETYDKVKNDLLLKDNKKFKELGMSLVNVYNNTLSYMYEKIDNCGITINQNLKNHIYYIVVMKDGLIIKQEEAIGDYENLYSELVPLLTAINEGK